MFIPHNTLTAFLSKREILWWVNVTSNNKTHLNLHVNCPIFSPDFNKTWYFSTDYNNSHEHRISHKSIQWEPTWYKRTDGRADAPQCSVKLTCLYRSGLGSNAVLATFRRNLLPLSSGKKNPTNICLSWPTHTYDLTNILQPFLSARS